MLRRLSRRLDQGRADDGFSLVELVVAMMVMLIVMSALLGVFVEALSTVSQSKQRQAATALSTQVMEQMRALPYDDVTKPTSSAAPAGDPNVVYTTPPRFRPAAVPGVDEVLVVNTVSPKLTTHNLEGVTYQVRQYVARALAAGTEQPYQLTVITTWSSAASRGAKTTVERSAVYSPSGCLSTATRPFSGPCQAAFTAQAGQTVGGISVTNPVDSAAPLVGFDGRQAALELPLLSADMQMEQTSNAAASTATTGAFTRSGDDIDRSGAQSAATAVDSDPSSAVGQSQTAATPAQTTQEKVLTGAGGTLRVAPSSTDAGSAGSAVNAEPAQCSGGDAAGTSLTTGPVGQRRPCASTTVRASGADATVTYQLPTPAAASSAPFVVASVGAAPAPARAAAAHLVVGNTNGCPGTSGVGCAHASAFRALGTVTAGALPAGGPAGYDGAFQVTGLVESVRTERGLAARASLYERSGEIRWWTGGGYSAPLSLTSTSSQDITVAPATWSSTSPTGGVVTVEVSTVLRIRPAQVPAPSGPADCKASACLSSASAAAGVTGETTYVVTVDGAELTRFLVSTDLGGLLAETSYRAAPDA